MEDPTSPGPGGTTDLRRRDTDGPVTPVCIHVCTMCNDRRRGGMRAGRTLFAELAAAAATDAAIDVVAIECMSVCKPQITMSFTASGKWSHVFAIASNTDPAKVLDAARLYARSRTGIFMLGGCEVLRDGVIARVPPVGAPQKASIP